MENQLIRSTPLENGLTLNLYDSSKVAAGDRCYVALTAVIEIPVADIDPAPRISAADLRQAVGDVVRYEQKRERHFIDVREKDALLESMAEQLLAASVGYLSHPDFPRKAVLREYAKARQRMSLRR